MRINFTRLGLILVILGVILMFNFWTAIVVQSFTVRIGDVEPNETFVYGLFMAPIGLGNLVVEGTALEFDPEVGDVFSEFATPVHLVVVSPSDVVLVDAEVITPYTVQVDFNERGEYIVYVTNMGDERSPIPISIKFPLGRDVVNIEADKFLVSIILTASGSVLFCFGLGVSLVLKHKKSSFSK